MLGDVQLTPLLVGFQWGLGAAALVLTISDLVKRQQFRKAHIEPFALAASVFVVEFVLFAALAIQIIVVALAILGELLDSV